MADPLSPIDTAKFVAAKRAVDFVEDGMKLGLGTGSHRRLDGALPGRDGARGRAAHHRRADLDADGGAGARRSASRSSRWTRRAGWT